MRSTYVADRAMTASRAGPWLRSPPSAAQAHPEPSGRRFWAASARIGPAFGSSAYPVSIGNDGSAAHSDSEASYTATFSWPSMARTNASLLAAMPPPQ